MFASHRPAASAYRNLDLETSVAQADPHTLVAMLYDGAIAAVARAGSTERATDPAARGAATTRALRILEEGLKASLDPRGGEITANLHALYDYMIRELLTANAAADRARYAEVSGMLHKLRDAWNAIAPRARRAPVSA